MSQRPRQDPSTQKLWFFRAAERAGVSPTLAAILIGLSFCALSPLVAYFSGPIEYVRKDFESLVPYYMALSLVFFVAVLRMAERWAASAIEVSRPYLRSVIDPFRHPRSVSWIGAVFAISQLVPIHEVNTSRWSRFWSGDWNAFDVWVVVIVGLALVLTFQCGFALMFLGRSLGRLGGQLSLDLFDAARGRPFARFAVRIAATVAVMGVGLGLSALVGAWSYGPAIWSASINLATSGLLLVLCAAPFVRSMHALRKVELARVQAALAGDRDALDSSPFAAQLHGTSLVELLSYRREVRAASVWPLDAALWARWLLYLLLPPLSWVAAALVEGAVQGAFPD
jgi:hypothetical protein